MIFINVSTLVLIKMAKLDDTIDLLQQKVEKFIPNLFGEFFNVIIVNNTIIVFRNQSTRHGKNTGTLR